MDDNIIKFKKDAAENKGIAHLCGVAVIFGLIIEVIFAFTFPKSDSIIEKWGTIFSDALVALGVWGEIHFAGKASKSEEQLQHIYEVEIAQLNERAQQAIKEAAETRERAAKIELLTSWRHVPKEKRNVLIDFLKKIEIPILLRIDHQAGDPEAYSYACEIAKVFQDAGIKVTGQANAYLGVTVMGLHITSLPEVDIASILKALEDAGIHFGGIRDAAARVGLTGEPKPNLYIYVGPKNPPIFEF